MRTDILKQRFLKSFGPLFSASQWSEHEQQALVDSVEYRVLDAGTVLMRPGAICRQLPLVISGNLRVFKTAESGREITLYRVRAGQSCMLSTACGSGPLSFPAIAQAELTTAAAFVPDKTVARLLSGSPAFITFIMNQYAQRTMEVMELVEEVAFRHVDERLREFLLRYQGTGESAIKMTHRQLADQIGTSREVVSRILKDWEDRGALSISRGSITLRPAFAESRF